MVSESDLIRSVEQSSQAAQSPANHLLRISPQSPRRYRESAYLEQPIDLSFQQLTLPQLLNYLLELCQKNQRLSIQTLRLTAPGEGTNKETRRRAIRSS